MKQRTLSSKEQHKLSSKRSMGLAKAEGIMDGVNLAALAKAKSDPFNALREFYNYHYGTAKMRPTSPPGRTETDKALAKIHDLRRSRDDLLEALKYARRLLKGDLNLENWDISEIDNLIERDNYDKI